MLQPVTDSQNCESDSDELLVTVLKRSAEALKTGGPRAASIAGAESAREVLGEGTAISDSLPSDEEEDFEDCKTKEVLDLVGGYIVQRLYRHKNLQCTACKTV